MKVLQISSHAQQGGAGWIAWYLFEGYKQRGIDSYLVVGRKNSPDPRIIDIDASKRYRTPLNRIRKRLDLKRGLENFNFPATKDILKLIPSQVDLIHGHNLHGGYFDLRVLPALSQRRPTVLTLHDTWMLSGHCAYFLGCERWQHGCGECPDLTLPPRVQRDATRVNWLRKRKIYDQCKLYVATPSQWLLDHVQNSMLLPAVKKARVIHNGIDQSVYKPAEKTTVREQLNLPDDSFVILYVVASQMKTNPYKDYDTIERALGLLQRQALLQKRIIFLGLGQQAETEVQGNLEKRFIPYLNDSKDVAKYYQAADVYVHATNADNFPNVIIEALSCGLPVIATDVGGIREQLIDGKTGILVPAKDAAEMSNMLYELISNEKKGKHMSIEAAQDAKKRFALNRMIDDYLDFYQDVLCDFHGSQTE